MQAQSDDKVANIYEKIKSIVIRYQFRIDDPLSEAYFVNLLGVSRTPIREALQRLQHEGLIYVIPKQGIVVRELTMSDAFQMLEMRYVVERHLIHQSIITLDEQDFVQLQCIIDEQMTVAEKRDYANYLLLDQKFHDYCYHKYENRYMKDFLNNFRDRFYQLRYQQLTVPGRVEKSIAEHGVFVKHCRNHDYDAANELLDTHTQQMRLVMHTRFFQHGMNKE